MRDGEMPERLPPQIAVLPRDAAGSPIPLLWTQLDGGGLVPRQGWFVHCQNNEKCWVCGRRLGARRYFLMTLPNYFITTAFEPPAHEDCLLFAVERTCWQKGLLVLWEATKNTYTYKPWPGRQYGECQLGRAYGLVWFLNGRRVTDFATIKNALEEYISAAMAYLGDQPPLNRERVEQLVTSLSWNANYRVYWKNRQQCKKEKNSVAGSTGTGRLSRERGKGAAKKAVRQRG